MRKGKATGLDRVPGEIYKLVENEVAPTSNLAKGILTMLSSVFLGKEFPKEWMDCIVVPIFKKGDKFDPNNYRGIALINTLLKVLCKVIASRLAVVCNEKGLFIREQSGFIAREECTAQAATLLECCQRRKFKDKDTLLCFLDLKKAYDLVPHDRLLSKLRCSGLGKTVINFIEKMYNTTSIKIKIGNKTSQSFTYKRGVRQGCPTSPLLFNIYINDLLDNIKPVPVIGLENNISINITQENPTGKLSGLRGLMFADDTVIAATTQEDSIDKLNKIDHWMVDNAMEINPSKCGIMEIVRDTPLIQTPVKYHGEIIPVVDKYTYLGIEFNKELDINIMAKFRTAKGKETLEILRKSLSNQKVPLEYRTMLIRNVIIPTLHYGAEIFGMSIL